MMLRTLHLLLPAVIPSWRFFDEIAPSPRIEFALLGAADAVVQGWQEFRPRPERLSAGDFLWRMVWNARWNESLFLVSCAERLMAAPTEHSVREIFGRIEAEVGREGLPYVQFRLVFVSRQEVGLQKDVVYVSPVHRMGAV